MKRILTAFVLTVSLLGCSSGSTGSTSGQQSGDQQSGDQQISGTTCNEIGQRQRTPENGVETEFICSQDGEKKVWMPSGPPGDQQSGDQQSGDQLVSGASCNDLGLVQANVNVNGVMTEFWCVQAGGKNVLMASGADGPFQQDCDPLRADVVPRDRQWFRTEGTFLVSAQNPEVLYVTVEHFGPFRSTDGGANWEPIVNGIAIDIFDRETTKNCYGEHNDAVIDPTNDQHVIMLGSCGGGGTIDGAMCHEGGIWETLNGGTTWQQKAEVWMNAYNTHLALESEDTQTYYYTSASQPGSYDGAAPDNLWVTKGIIYVTRDGGSSWEELPTGFSKGLRASNIVVDPSNPLVLTVSTYKVQYATTENAANSLLENEFGLIQSIDGGATWSRIGNLPASAQNGTFVGEPKNGNVLYFQPFSAGSRPDGAFVSSDRGTTWKKVPYMDVVAYDPQDPLGKRMLGYVWSACQGQCKSVLYASKDGGLTWQSNGPLPKEITEVMNIKSRIEHITYGSDSKTIYLNGSNAYVWVSRDSGATWTTLLSLEKVKSSLKS